MDARKEYAEKWVAETGAPPTVPSLLLSSPSVNADGGDEDAVIMIHSMETDGSQLFSWRKLMWHIGPGFLMCIAYIDPGNLEADLQTGFDTGYSLLWLLLLATAMGYLLQSLSAKLGVATGRHLAQHCRERYPGRIRIVLWLMAELAIIGSDVQEVIGAAIAASLLTRGALPLWGGVIFAAVSAYTFLFLEKLGVRWLEAFFQLLVAIMAITMGTLFFVADVPYAEVIRGFAVPRLSVSSLPTAAALIGSILMPHNLFLHSALVHNRAMPAALRACGLRESLRYYNIESAAALAITLGINTAVISVFSKGFHGRRHKSEIGLENAGQYLGSRFGKHTEVIWAVGLLAAGQSSTMTGTYAGQYVMSGYLNLQIAPFKRALVTRAVAVGPTLLVALYARADSTRMDVLNQWINILQAATLPFAVIPLLVLTSDRAVMGIGFSSNTRVKRTAWVVAAGVMAVNAGVIWHTAAASLQSSVAVQAAFWGVVAAYGALLAYLLSVSWPNSAGGPLSGEEGEAGDIVTPLLRALPRPPAILSPTGSSQPMSARSQLSSHAIDTAGSDDGSGGIEAHVLVALAETPASGPDF